MTDRTFTPSLIFKLIFGPINLYLKLEVNTRCWNLLAGDASMKSIRTHVTRIIHVLTRRQRCDKIFKNCQRILKHFVDLGNPQMLEIWQYIEFMVFELVFCYRGQDFSMRILQSFNRIRRFLKRRRESDQNMELHERIMPLENDSWERFVNAYMNGETLNLRIQSQAHDALHIITSAKVQLVSVKISKDQTSERLQCSVCLEEYNAGEEAKRLPCNHLFHLKCIKHWLTRNSSCPYCRTIFENLDILDSDDEE